MSHGLVVSTDIYTLQPYSREYKNKIANEKMSQMVNCIEIGTKSVLQSATSIIMPFELILLDIVSRPLVCRSLQAEKSAIWWSFGTIVLERKNCYTPRVRIIKSDMYLKRSGDVNSKSCFIYFENAAEFCCTKNIQKSNLTIKLVKC